jgi:steroid 5-alpha reductase family enzyme
MAPARPPALPPSLLALNYGLVATAWLPAALLARRWLADGTAPAAPAATGAALLAASFALGWAASLALSSTWLIDPYWTIVPPLLNFFFARACAGRAATANPRAAVWTALLAVWAVRLTHNYGRREGWARLGWREDWRYDAMRVRWGKWWPLIQVVPVYAVQHVLLYGLSLPFAALQCGGGASPAAEPWPAARAAASPWWASLLRVKPPPAHAFTPPPFPSPLDTVALALAVAGLATAAVADNQLHRFVEANRAAGVRGAVLSSGLWARSRHPNYVGETAWWAGTALAGVAGGAGAWAVGGVAVNTACLAAVTRMTEARTAAAPGRGAAWREYCARTPCWVGW